MKLSVHRLRLADLAWPVALKRPPITNGGQGITDGSEQHRQVAGEETAAETSEGYE